MQDITKKLVKWMEMVNTTYAFAVLIAAIAVFIARHSKLALWIAVCVGPILGAWGGYLIKAYIERRNYLFGFKLRKVTMSYEIGNNHRYKLHYAGTIQAITNHSMVYPIGYQWTGSGEESVPKLTSKGQYLLAPVQGKIGREKMAKVVPYIVNRAANGDWRYWFIALNPPIDKGDEVTIKYSQEFNDKKGIAKPYLYYNARVPFDHLELNVKFPAGHRPNKIVGEYIKPSDPHRPFLQAELTYDPEKLWISWVVERPKKGYWYRIRWE